MAILLVTNLIGTLIIAATLGYAIFVFQRESTLTRTALASLISKTLSLQDDVATTGAIVQNLHNKLYNGTHTDPATEEGYTNGE